MSLPIKPQQAVSQANPQMPSLITPDENTLKISQNEGVSQIKKGPLTTRPSYTESVENKFNIGMVIHSTRASDRHISAVSKPASCCYLSFLVFLERPQENEEEVTRQWLKQNNVSKDVEIRWGEEGLKQLFESDVDALYLIVEAEFQRECVLRSLRARKHVLLNDPVSTSLADFKEQQACAKENGKFVQFMTMFVHLFATRRFIDSILLSEGFGQIMNINCEVRINYYDAQKVGAKLPLQKHHGIIRIMGRFCALVSALFFSRVGSFARSAKVISAIKNDDGVVISAKCVVKFTEDRILTFDVQYTNSSTRQLIDLEAETRTATMRDFIIEHPDRLATYRVYDKAPMLNGALGIVSGEAIDVAGGPPEEMMMWRRFAELSLSIDEQGGWDRTVNTAECRELANVALQTKRILIALMKSLENSFEEVIIDDIDYQ